MAQVIVHLTPSSPKLQKIKSDQSQTGMTLFISAPPGQLTPLSCTAACDTARYSTPPSWLQAAAISTPSSQTSLALSARCSPGFLCPPLQRCCVGSNGHRGRPGCPHHSGERGHDAFSLRRRWCARRRGEQHHLRGGREGIDSRRTGLPVPLPHRLSRHPPPALGGLGHSREPAAPRGPGGKGAAAPPPPGSRLPHRAQPLAATTARPLKVSACVENNTPQRRQNPSPPVTHSGTSTSATTSSR